MESMSEKWRASKAEKDKRVLAAGHALVVAVRRPNGDHAACAKSRNAAAKAQEVRTRGLTVFRVLAISAHIVGRDHVISPG